MKDAAPAAAPLADAHECPRDDTEITDLLRTYGPRLLAYIARRTGDRDDAADLFSETITTLWRRRDHIPDSTDEAFAWMIGVARHTLANGARARARRSALMRRLSSELLVRSARSARNEIGDRVQSALAMLSPDDQEILKLDAWDGLSGPQIAESLGRSHAAARQRLARARTRLRKALSAST